MPSTHRIITQTGIQLLGKIMSTAFGVAAIAIITRSLGRAGFGEYATVMAYLQLFGIAVDLGLNVLAPSMLGERNGGHGRWLLRDDEHARLLSNIFTIRLVAAVVTFALAAAVAFAIPTYSLAVRLGIAVATLSFLAIVCTQILQAPFQVAADMRGPTLAEVLGRAMLVALLALATARDAGLLAIVWATVVGNVATFLITFLAAQRLICLRLAFDFPMWRNLLRRSWPIALSILFNLVYLRADQILLSFLQPVDHVGLYAAPYRLIDVLTQFPYLLMGLVLPTLAAAWAAGDRPRLHAQLQRTFNGLAFLAFPLVAGAIVLGTPIMILVAGEAFTSSGPILGVLAVALLGIFLGQPFGYAVVAVDAQRTMLRGYAVVAVATLAGYLVAIPIWSYWGAAWMTVASELVIAVWTFAVVRRVSGFRIAWLIPVTALAASVVMGIAVALLPLPTIPRIMLGIVTYGLLVLVLPPTRRMVITMLTY